jgi:hypothetical protein
MSGNRELSNGAGEDRGWLSIRQLAAVAAFAAVFAALVVWTTVAVPSPIADFNVERLVPTFAVTSAGAEATRPEATRPEAAP